MQNLPFYVYLIFGATIVSTIFLLFKATHYSRKFLTIVIVWIVLQGGLAYIGFYNDKATMTSRFPLLFAPALLFLLTRLTTKKGKVFLSQLDLPTLTLINTARLPVELVLYWLFIQKTIPEAMTFHGRNFDILAGLTAPIVYYFGFIKKTISTKVILIWNIICLGLLFNIVSNALLSLPARYQQFGFERPNEALGYFPFNLLPAFLLPSVLFSMSASIRLIVKNIKNPNMVLETNNRMI